MKYYAWKLTTKEVYSLTFLETTIASNKIAKVKLFLRRKTTKSLKEFFRKRYQNKVNHAIIDVSKTSLVSYKFFDFIKRFHHQKYPKFIRSQNLQENRDLLLISKIVLFTFLVPFWWKFSIHFFVFIWKNKHFEHF